MHGGAELFGDVVEVDGCHAGADCSQSAGEVESNVRIDDWVIG